MLPVPIKLPIMLELCLIHSLAYYYVKIYASIINSGLPIKKALITLKTYSVNLIVSVPIGKASLKKEVWQIARDLQKCLIHEWTYYVHVYTIIWTHLFTCFDSSTQIHTCIYTYRLHMVSS